MFEKLFKPASISETENSQAKEAEKQQQLQFELEQINLLSDAEQLSHAAIAAAFTQARQTAAHKVEQESFLHKIEKESRDKSVQHIVREKIKALKKLHAEQEESQKTIEELCKKIEQLSKASTSPLYKAQLQHILESWNQLNTELHQQEKQKFLPRFEQAHSICISTLNEMEAEAKKWEAVRQADEAAKQAALEKTEEIEQKKEQLEQAKQKNEATKEEHAKQQGLLERSLLEQIEAIEKNIEEGIISNISKKISSVQKKLDAMDNALIKKHEGKVTLLKNKLNEMKDWQSFAAIPKKQELCTKMEALATSPLEPVAQSKAIQNLQGQWKELKGGGNEEEQKIWEKFKEISDKAYEPCKAYFAKQKEVRAENLKQRQLVCDELESFEKNYHWDNPDWKAVDKIINKAKNEFFRLSPIDHKHQETIKKRYQAAITPLIERLKPEQKKNEAECLKLIESAKKLLEMEDFKAATEQTKTLQAQWKEIGITHPNENQKLWQKFRDACDAIFNKRNEERDHFKQQLSQELKQADEICGQIEKLGQLTGEPLKNSRQQYQDLRQAFLNIKQLRKDKQKKLFSRFYQACDDYQNQIERFKKNQKNAALTNAIHLAFLCDQIENNISSENIISTWPTEIDIPAEFKDSLAQRKANAIKISSGELKTDFELNEKNRRLILIQIEILLDKESPTEDKSLRMQHQLQQLSNKGLSGKTQNKKEQLNDLILQWIKSPAPIASSAELLKGRLETLIQ